MARLPRLPALSAFQANAFTWNFALGMTNLLVPLYARDLGMNGVSIGSLIALPVLIQIWLNLLGGAYADRIGAKRTSIFACVFLAMGAAGFALSASFAGLLMGQFMMILSRAAFWPSNWALASQMPGDRSRNMGRLNATTNAGQIFGIALTGMIIAHLGFRSGFWTMAGVGLLALVFSLFIAQQRASHTARPALFATYRALLKRRPIYLAVMCAYVSALPFSLSVSFFPILLVEQGFSSEATGWLLAFRAVGSIFAGVALARLVRRATDSTPPFVATVVSAVTVGLVAVFAHPVWAGLFLVGIGASSGVMTVYFQILISTISSAEQRASAMALGGLGWGLSNFSTPLIVGWITDLWGIQIAFYVLGGVVLMVALAFPATQRWAFGEMRHAA
jgi:DHA1 family multidrug resistance protein-like MFS transporter